MACPCGRRWESCGGGNSDGDKGYVRLREGRD